jgi:hypothetical protein
MRIPIPCLKCLDAEASGLVYAVSTLDDDGRFTGQCENGHDVICRTPRPPHEWLTTAGALAFLDGYHREAASSFAAALESSFAFYVEVSLHQAGLELEAVRELLRKSKLDQRRAGMVSVCYLRDTGKQFPYLQQKWVEFRNNVVHNGHWPTRSKTLEYADYVCRSISELYDTLGPKLEPHYHHRLGEVVLGLKEEEFSMDDFQPFLSFYIRSTSAQEALMEFSKHGPHRTIGGPRPVRSA